jgi:hypothetical protein
MPSRAPVTRIAIGMLPCSHLPARVKASPCGMRRAAAIMSPSARSATQSFSTSGVLVTTMPRRRVASKSTASTPTPNDETISSLGSASMMSAESPTNPEVCTPRMRGATSARSFALSAAAHSLCTVNSRSSRSRQGAYMLATERISTVMAAPASGL